ncbi:hypothetical protein [Olsenella sp. An290]|uniref:hypothetical protein n=1 Tax=Olsenella sp. An290 TaxID=1965625 RepID=UPI000B37FF93|nr:hypothetical protein [Olsenella sp. An290]OUO34473.1 hypothetical protein B5F84_06420 [Olsenella sp. An290]
MSHSEDRREGVSPQTDELASALMGDALDLMAAGREFEVLLVIEDKAGEVTSYEFKDDGPEACLEGAHERVTSLPHAVRYAIAYEGAVEDDSGSYADALLLEFGERGYRSYSAYSLVDGKGAGDGFTWTDPAPAGELPPLL